MKALFHFDYSGVRRHLLEALVIVCLGIGIGLSVNYPLLHRVFRPAPATQRPDPSAAMQPVSVTLEEVRTLGSGALRVDARIRELYRAGHLADAVALPLDEADAALPAFVASVPKNRALVVYCSGYGCPDSFDLAARLLDAGYADIMVYEGGYPEWRDAGLPVETEE